MEDIKVVVLGGGTGSFTVLSGLKKYVKNITALVSMADDGGSTGQLRDELGVLPPGDVRQCLVALSESPKLRELFNYRFENGNCLSGHSFGNLFLTALEKTTGSFAEAVDLASTVLDIGKHHVVPITLDKVTLIANDGEREIRHEREIREAVFKNQRPKISMEPNPEPNPAALRAIAEADLVVVAPGGLYESLGATLAIKGVGKALANSSARVIYICNLMNQANHTADFSVIDYADELERLAGCEFIDEVIYNTRKPSSRMLELYAREGEHPVYLPDGDIVRHYELRGLDMLSWAVWQNESKADPLAHQRALIRHDIEKLATSVLGSFENREQAVRTLERLYVLDMDRTLIKSGSLFRCLCETANIFQDHLGDELTHDYQKYLVARNTPLTDLDLESDNVYIQMRLEGKTATFDPTSALNRILGKRMSTVTARDVYDSMAEQLLQNERYYEYLLPGAEEILRFIDERDNTEAIILTYGEFDFQNAKFKAVVEPLLQKYGMRPRLIATPDRRKANFFREHLTRDKNYEFKNIFGLDNIHAQMVVHVGDERDDIIHCESLPNYRAYCVKSPLDHSNRPWPTDEELSANHCELFENLSDVVAKEQLK